MNRLRFPAMECFAFVFALPGMAESTGALLASGDDVAFAIGSTMLLILIAVVVVIAWILLIVSRKRLIFDEVSGEYEHKKAMDNFKESFHGLGLTDVKPGYGMTYLWTTVLLALARSVTIGSYSFACPVGKELLCGYVQSFLVLTLLVLTTFMLVMWAPFIDEDDQLVESVSAWCNVFTLLCIMWLPTVAGGRHETTVGWLLLVLQGISIMNQIWYNVKPLLVMLYEWIASKCCPPKDQGEEGVGLKGADSDSEGEPSYEAEDPVDNISGDSQFGRSNSRLSDRGGALSRTSSLAADTPVTSPRARPMTPEHVKPDWSTNGGSSSGLLRTDTSTSEVDEVNLDV